MKLLVQIETVLGDDTFKPGIHEVTPVIAECFYIRGTGRPATQSEIAESERDKTETACATPLGSERADVQRKRVSKRA